jgi:hypothetical protein
MEDLQSKRIELASDLAHDRTLYESGDICNNEDEMWKDPNAISLTYKEEIQNRFNEWYDFYLSKIESIIK